MDSIHRHVVENKIAVFWGNEKYLDTLNRRLLYPQLDLKVLLGDVQID